MVVSPSQSTLAPLTTFFASSPLRGEDNESFAKQCFREVGVTSGREQAAKSPPPRPSPLKGEGGKEPRERGCGVTFIDLISNGQAKWN
jgi:hypothetical protein